MRRCCCCFKCVGAGRTALTCTVCGYAAKPNTANSVVSQREQKARKCIYPDYFELLCHFCTCPMCCLSVVSFHQTHVNTGHFLVTHSYRTLYCLCTFCKGLLLADLLSFLLLLKHELSVTTCYHCSKVDICWHCPSAHMCMCMLQKKVCHKSHAPPSDVKQRISRPWLSLFSCFLSLQWFIVKKDSTLQLFLNEK